MWSEVGEFALRKIDGEIPYPKRAPDKIVDGANDARKLKIGCVAILLVPITMIGFGAYLGAEEDKEWAAAQPPQASLQEWASRRERCEVARMAPAKCAATSVVIVEAAARKQDNIQRAEFCAEDVGAEAKDKALEAVKASLKSPATSEFDETTVNVSQKGCDWTVKGDVDAQNSFGALLRSSYRVELKRVAKDTWIVMSTRLD